LQSVKLDLGDARWKSFVELGVRQKPTTNPDRAMKGGRNRI